MSITHALWSLALMDRACTGMRGAGYLSLITQWKAEAEPRVASLKDRLLVVKYLLITTLTFDNCNRAQIEI